MVEKSRLDPAAVLASERLFLSLSTLAGWRNYESRSELQTEGCLCGAEGWGGVGWEVGAAAHWLPPVNAGMTVASALSPGLLLCLSSVVTYLFWYCIPLLNFPHLKLFGLWEESVLHLNLLQPDSGSRAHDPAPGPAVQAGPILPPLLLRPFSRHSALAAEWAKCGNSITAQGRGG